jgi:hypothetical protein
MNSGRICDSSVCEMVTGTLTRTEPRGDARNCCTTFTAACASDSIAWQCW